MRCRSPWPTFVKPNRLRTTLILSLSLVLLTLCRSIETVETRDAGVQDAQTEAIPIINDGFVLDEHAFELVDEEDLSKAEQIRATETMNKDEHKADKHVFDKVCPYGFFACANGECLSPKWRCDGHYDCDDFSDELNCTLGDSPFGHDPKFDIQQIVKTPAPPVIHAEPAESGELKFESAQEPLMLFSTGLSIRGYWMRERIYFDVISTGLRPPKKADAPSITQALSIFFDMLSIQPPNPTSSQSHKDAEELTIKSRSTIVGVDMDPSNKEVFWVELGKDAGIFSTVIDDKQFETRNRRQQIGPRHKTIVDSGLLSPEDIALDNVGKNIYVTDAGLPAIVACSIKHSHCKMIVTDNIHKPRAIIADSTSGWLTYTDWGDHPGIFLVSMDGSKRETLVDTDVVWPNGLAADYASNQLYWADARLNKIEKVDLKTKKRKSIISQSATNPFSLSLFENRIYWSDWSGGDIRTCDKNFGNETKTVLRADNIYGIHIYHPNISGKSVEQSNPCWSKRCSHLCLLTPDGSTFADRNPAKLTATCACPESMDLSVGDKATCYETHLAFLLINVKNYIAQVFPERIGLQTVEKIIYSKDHIIHDVASDWMHFRLFFFDAVKRQIYSVNLNSKDVKVEPFMPTSQSVRGLLYDAMSANLYWLDVDRGTLTMCSVSGKFETIIRKDLERPISMVLDIKNRVFYIAMLGSRPHILRTNIFGDVKSDLKIIDSDIGLPVALHLDEKRQRLYWADARRETIESIDLDIKSKTNGLKPDSRIVHRRRLGTILAFAVYQDSFLWTIKNGDYLYKAKMGDLTSDSPLGKLEEHKPIGFKLPPNPSARDPSSDNKRIVLVDPHREAVSSPCTRKGCSHGCVVGENRNAVCVCPDAYKLSSTNQSNCVLSSKQQCHGAMFRCLDTSNCILESWKCDGTNDCDDGSDEKDCRLPPECPSGDFNCKNGRCISRAWHCDGSDDCNDNSDEENCPKRPNNSCTVGYFPCGDGKCIPQLWRCDREHDCANGADEKDCRTEECKDNFFRCKEHNCIPKNWLCDDYKDCPGGEDEEKCAEAKCKTGEQFLCDNHLCMDIRLKCDGRKDCVDGTDELNCTEHHSCPSHMVTCASDHHCIYKGDLCDGHQDCDDGSDEKNCTNRQACASYETQCETIINGHNSSVGHKKCIPRAWLCDGEDDCGDWSDEISEKCHPGDHLDTTTSRPCHDGSFPCSSGECVKWAQVCDQEDNCLDGSDEGGRCLVACSINNGGCAQQCRPSPSGPSCSCHDGYIMSNDTKSCEDIDECARLGTCSHHCHNFKGGYKCACADGYLLASDKRHCKAIGDEEPFILFLLPNKILSTSLVRYQEELIANSSSVDLVGMDFDYDSRKVFWSDGESGQILSQTWGTKHITSAHTVEFDGLKKPAHIAFDWVTRNLYFSQDRGTVHVCNVDSKKCAKLFNGRIIRCNSLALAPSVGYLFWTVPSDETSTSGFVSGIIERAEMDGTNRRTIVSDKIHLPMGLAVDFVLGRIYWTDMKMDEISSVDFAGRRRQMVVSYGLQNPIGLSLFEDSLFVSNVGSDSLMRLNKFSGTARQTLNQEMKSNVVRVVHRMTQPLMRLEEQQLHGCLNNTCQYLCALTNRTGPGCICPENQVLASDRHTCRPYDPVDCGGDSARCNAGSCKPSGLGWRCLCPPKTWGPFCDVDSADGHSSAMSSNGIYDDADGRAHGNTMVWLIVLLLLLSVLGLITVVSLLILYKQGRLPRQVSQLSVSFISQSHDKDGAMLLLDSDN